MSESEKTDNVEVVESDEEATPTPEKTKINDPLTQSSVEAPRRPWMPQRPSPPGRPPEGDDET